MPAQGTALSGEEIANVVAYAKTLAPGSDMYPPGELNFFLPVRTKKAFPEDEIVWKGRLTERDDGENVMRNVIEIEKRFGKRSMGVLEVIHEDDGVDNEITKVEAGVKTVLHWSMPKQSILSGALIVAVPTDDEESEEIIPYLAYGKRLSDEWIFQSSARVIVPVDDTNQGEVELAGIVHYEWYHRARAMFPALELTAAVPFDAGDDDSVQWTVLPQVPCFDQSLKFLNAFWFCSGTIVAFAGVVGQIEQFRLAAAEYQLPAFKDDALAHRGFVGHEGVRAGQFWNCPSVRLEDAYAVGFRNIADNVPPEHPVDRCEPGEAEQCRAEVDTTHGRIASARRNARGVNRKRNAHFGPVNPTAMPEVVVLVWALIPACSADWATFSPCSSVPVRKNVSSPMSRCQRASASAMVVVYA